MHAITRRFFVSRLAAMPLFGLLLGARQGSTADPADDIVMLGGWVLRRSDLEQVTNDL